VPLWRRFVAQFEDVLVILLLVATFISAVLWAFERDTTLPYEAIAIFAVVLLNATMGYVQETRAEAAVAALRAMSAADATVLRDGERRNIAAAAVVPGDVILIEEGDTIPADARVVDSTALQTAEASLTGESLPIAKDTRPIAEDTPLGDRHNMVFSGTAATYGHGVAVVTATGMRTETGRIAGLLKETVDESTPLQRELDRTGKLLGFVVVGIAIVMIAHHGCRGRSRPSCNSRRADSRCGTSRCRSPRGTSCCCDSGTVDRRATHVAAERDRAASGVG
jgi:Ca2+-transporting ATPase